MRKLLIKMCPRFIHKYYGDIKFWIRFHFFRKGLISEEFKGLLGYSIDWDNPQDLNEKINWQKLYSDTSKWTNLADKFLARDYIAAKLGNHVLPELYGVWKKAKDIDFDNLPNRFVLKTNHGCGDTIIVKDKSNLNKDIVRKEMSEAVKQKYGYRTIEPHYINIQPIIMAEQLIENDATFSMSIVDYKVWCINGKPECILICSDRTTTKCTLSWYDTKWNYLSNVNSGRHYYDDKRIPQPDCLEQMLEYASILADGFPQIRVDFYIERNKLYVGELTFTSQGGYMDYLSRDFSKKLGKNIPLLKK